MFGRLSYTTVYSLMMGQQGPKHVAVCVSKHYFNSNRVCALVGHIVTITRIEQKWYENQDGRNSELLNWWLNFDYFTDFIVSVIQQDTQYLMINFIHNIQQLNIFRSSIVHLQERSYTVCCNLVCLDTSCCYEGEGRTAVLPSPS